MEIFINLVVSKSVTPEEWAKVYNETLVLLKNFPLARIKKVNIHGMDITCLTPSEGEEDGWCTTGDCTYIRTAENYFLPKNLVDGKVEMDALDAILGAVPAYLDYDWDNECCNHVYRLWGNKTQGMPYHTYLLAIAALIEARLGTKAFTYGDITRGQFKRAVEIANQYLEHRIDMPDRCYMDRLLKRVRNLPLSVKESISVFEQFYLGTKDAEFGQYMRGVFHEDEITNYWKEKFSNRKIGTIGFDEVFNDYLLWGFDLADLCCYVDFHDDEFEYEKFVRRVMDSKLHIKEKDSTDVLKINQEEERPYSTATLFAKILFAGAQTKKVDRFIPIYEIRESLLGAIGDKCDVNGIIDAYLEEESKQKKINITDKSSSTEDLTTVISKDPAEFFRQFVEREREKIKEKREEYDIDDYDGLPFYEIGDTVEPNLEQAVSGSRKYLDSILDESEFEELMKKSARQKCQWMIEQNREILMRDSDWEKVFKDIENNPDSFRRYYPLFRVSTDEKGLLDMVIAFITNDDFYEYSSKLAFGTSDRV